MSIYKGALITCEGMDGSGKTSAFDNAFSYFSKKFPGRLDRFRDPGSKKGNDDICEQIRELLLYHKKKIDPWTEFYLFMASRSQLITEYLIPNLDQNKIVFLDRFYDSTIAFQGFANGIPLDSIFYENSKILRGTEPDLTLLYHLPIEMALERNLKDKKKRLTTFDKEKIDFHEKIVRGYDYVSRKYKKRIKIIDATKSLEEVSEQTIQTIDKFLENYFLEQTIKSKNK